MSEIRTNRIAAQIREEISRMIIQGKIKDPRVTSYLSVTDVRVSRDVSTAKVYISSFENAAELKTGVDGLNHAAGFIQSRLAKHLHTRNTPRLQFIDDHSVEYGIKMIKKIEDLNI